MTVCIYDSSYIKSWKDLLAQGTQTYQYLIISNYKSLRLFGQITSSFFNYFMHFSECIAGSFGHLFWEPDAAVLPD